MKQLSIPIVLIASLAGGVAARGQSAEAEWQNLQFVVGNWDARGDEQRVEPLGSYSFQPELNGKILVRRAQAIEGKGVMGGAPGYDDLLIVYYEAGAGGLQAIDFDTEGRVIHYQGKAENNKAVFDSLPSQPGPRYRLTYEFQGKKLHGSLEVAPEGSGDYTRYMSWVSTSK